MAAQSVENAACMESLSRISKLPVVDSTVKTATSIYGYFKDYNGITHFAFSTAETTLCKAVNIGKPIAAPVIKSLEGPIKKVDNVLCSSLDYVEEKVPVVKLPPAEIYSSTKDYLTNAVTPAVETAVSYAEPAVVRAINAVEPLVQPTIDKVFEIRSNVVHKLDEYIHETHQSTEVECHMCLEVRRKLEEEEEKKKFEAHEHHSDL